MLQYRDIRFRRWIVAHWAEISAGEAVFEGVSVGPDTVLIAYKVGYSAVFVARWDHTGPVVPGTPAARRNRWLSILVTGLAGWWSLTGFIHTLFALKDTIRDRPIKIRMADVANATLYGRALQKADLD